MIRVATRDETIRKWIVWKKHGKQGKVMRPCDACWRSSANAAGAQTRQLQIWGVREKHAICLAIARALVPLESKHGSITNVPVHRSVIE